MDVLPRSPEVGEKQTRQVGAFADKLPPIEIADIKAARREALLGGAE